MTENFQKRQDALYLEIHNTPLTAEACITKINELDRYIIARLPRYEARHGAEKAAFADHQLELLRRDLNQASAQMGETAPDLKDVLWAYTSLKQALDSALSLN